MEPPFLGEPLISLTVPPAPEPRTRPHFPYFLARWACVASCRECMGCGEYDDGEDDEPPGEGGIGDCGRSLDCFIGEESVELCRNRLRSWRGPCLDCCGIGKRLHWRHQSLDDVLALPLLLGPGKRPHMASIIRKQNSGSLPGLPRPMS